MAELISEHLEVADDFEAVQSLYLERGWTDGLPVVPPTAERVQAMLATTPRSCVISNKAMPSSACSSFTNFRMRAWIVTSSAVVGSSAIINAG